jgi:hypothetical protein
MNEAQNLLVKRGRNMECGIKRNQNRRQQRMMPLADSLRELQELGSAVDLSVATAGSRSCNLEIQQSGCIYDSKFFELENGRTGCMMDLDCYVHTSSPIHIVDVELRFPWKSKDHLFQWLTPHEVIAKNRGDKSTSSYKVYRFPGKSGLELPAEDVINGRLLEKKMLPARHPICGWLLATGGSMPARMLNGGWIDASLVITTWGYTELCQPIRLWTERLERRRRSALRTYDLFENRIEARVLDNTVQTRLAKSVVSKLGGGQQHAGD